jgi:hypothetical protein
LGTTFPLEAPSLLKATVLSATKIQLSWGDTNNIESGTSIQRVVGTEGLFADHATVGANVVTFTDANLSPDTLYTYRVRAISAVAQSSLGNNAAATTPRIPVAPSNLTAEAESGTSIRVRWQDNSRFETEFRIERRYELTDFAEIFQAPKNAVQYLDAGLTPNTTYTYRVRASHEGGASPYSNEASATTARGRIEVSPLALDFGTVLMGTSRTLPVKVRNRSAKETLHVPVEKLSSPYRIEGAQSFIIPAGGTQTINVRFAPIRRGGARGRLLLTSSDPKNERVRVRLRGKAL